MSKYIVDVSHLSVKFGDFYAVKDLSFQVSEGEVFGFLGANGAGKTTFYQTNQELLEMPRVNVDEIVRSIGSWDNPTDLMAGGKVAVKKIHEYLASDHSFNQETTLCGQSIWKNILIARERGFTVEMYYVGVESAELAWERVKKRVEAGGHGIPREDVVRRYAESIASLPRAISICDKVILYDNTDEFSKIAIFNFGFLEINS